MPPLVFTLFTRGFYFVRWSAYTSIVIIQLCDEHADLAGTLPIAQLREAWAWWNCPCRIILDND